MFWVKFGWLKFQLSLFRFRQFDDILRGRARLSAVGFLSMMENKANIGFSQSHSRSTPTQPWRWSGRSVRKMWCHCFSISIKFYITEMQCTTRLKSLVTLIFAINWVVNTKPDWYHCPLSSNQIKKRYKTRTVTLINCADIPICLLSFYRIMESIASNLG